MWARGDCASMRREEEERVSVSGGDVADGWSCRLQGLGERASILWMAPEMQEGRGHQSELGLGFEEGLTKQQMK